MDATSLVAGVVGALVSLVAVSLGAWLNSRRERRQWFRDQTLRAGTEFLTTTHHLLWQYRQAGKSNVEQIERREWRNRMQVARSALYLLTHETTASIADDVARRLHQTTPETDSQFNAETDRLFGLLVERLRSELD